MAYCSYQSLNMDLLSIKEPFMVQSAYAMNGDHLYSHHSASGTGHSWSSMHWVVTMADFPYRNITAHLMSDVCHNVGIESILQPITSERVHHNIANTEDGARVVIKAQGFWENDRQCAFFDVRMFNPLSHAYHSLSLSTCYKRHEQEKKKAYDEHIREVEHGCFSPLVFSVSGGMGPTAKVVYKKLASMITTKHNKSSNQTINWLSCRLSFSLLHSSIMCIRGSCSSANHPASYHISEAAIDRALYDSRVAS